MNALKTNPQHLPGAFLRFLIAALAAFFLAAPLAVSAADATPAPALAAGDVPPDYVGKTLDGVPIKLSGQAGKVIVVSYWATWCPYCLKELPILDNLQKLAGKEHMYVLGVNTEERAVFRKVLGAVSKMNMHFAYDPDGAAQKAYGVKGIPHMVIIGRDGKIIQVYRGYGEDMLDQIVAEINTALAAPVAGADPAPVQGAAQ